MLLQESAAIIAVLKETKSLARCCAQEMPEHLHFAFAGKRFIIVLRVVGGNLRVKQRLGKVISTANTEESSECGVGGSASWALLWSKYRH